MGNIVAAVLALALLVPWPPTDSAQAKVTSRPVQLIVPWAVGGGTDRIARMLAVLLEKELGQPVTVVNRTGGGGMLGHNAGATAAPDGAGKRSRSDTGLENVRTGQPRAAASLRNVRSGLTTVGCPTVASIGRSVIKSE